MKTLRARAQSKNGTAIQTAGFVDALFGFSSNLGDDYSGAWTDDSTFGDLEDRETTDYKSEAFASVTGSDLLIESDEYAFAFDAVLGSTDFAGFITDHYDSSSCSEDFIASGADWYSSELSEDQADTLSLIVQPKDFNSYGSRRGNDEVMARGTFANIRSYKSSTKLYLLIFG